MGRIKALEPPPPLNDEARRMRGGFFAEGPFFLRASNRSNDFFEGFEDSGVGFRVVWPSGGAGQVRL